MRLGVPPVPRPVSFAQVPGAFFRVGVYSLALLVVPVVTAAAVRQVGRQLSAEAAFLERAVEVEGQVVGFTLPPVEGREGATGRMSVIFSLDQRQVSASGVEVDAKHSEGLGRGAKVALYVDPADPEHPRDAWLVNETLPTRWFAPLLTGLVAAVGLLLVLREFRRAVRAEIEPLRSGLMVWLTPDQPLPGTRRETTFAASYFRNDVRYQVTARARPGRSLVKNQDKVLAAVVPGQPEWVRVIDEDLARRLGWYL